MCGIVGYLGEKNPKEVIIEGLRRLEYRGYDSAGIAVLTDQGIERHRAMGKLKVLEDKIANESLEGPIGIGHTRWATHGAPSEANAHPHRVDDIVIVHNGIIENYSELREQLVVGGAKLTSDTDSELVAHLIAKEIKSHGQLVEAVKRVIPQLRGAFSILAMWAQRPDQMVAFKDGPPLVIGKGKGEFVVASDIQAIVDHTREVAYLADREVAIIDREQIEIFSTEGWQVDIKWQTIDWDDQMAEKGGFSHFMLKEIHEQPRAFANAVQPYINIDEQTLSADQVFDNPDILDSIDRVYIVACGTSYYSGMYGKYLIEKMARIPVEVDIASEFRYRNPVLDEKCLFVSVSQSGETADTLAAVRLAKESGAQVLSICNVQGSSIDREADARMYMNSGIEIGVASTKAFMSSLGLFCVLGIHFGKKRGEVDASQEKEWISAILAVPSHIETMLAFDKFFAEASESLKSYRGFLYMGRGVNFPIALEGALKLKELAYLHAEGYAAGEMKHGPLALIDNEMCVVMIAPNDELYEKTLSNLQEVRARGGHVIAIGTHENQDLKDVSENYLNLPDVPWLINPILAVVPLQLMSFHLAESLGHDVDQPRNLAKSVTVE